MANQYLYKLSILNKSNSHPLEFMSYYSGENQQDPRSSKTYVSNTEDKVLWNNILVPSAMDTKFEHLPEYLKFRSNKQAILSNARNILWQQVFERETREDAQFARLFSLSIPYFLSKEKSVEIIEKFSTILVDMGMIVDASLHNQNKTISLLEQLQEDKKENESKNDYVGYLVTTLRSYENGNFVNKNREWNDRACIKNLRYQWVEILNDVIENHPVEEQKLEWRNKLKIYDEYQIIAKNYQKSHQKMKI